MNELYLLTDFLIKLFQSIELVNTITMVETKFIDNNKNNIYQLVNIDYLQSDIQDDAIVARYLITVVQQRDIRPQATDSKLQLDTNLIDNLSETHFTIQRALNVMERNHHENNIDLFSNTVATKLQDWNKNGLDGHQVTIELSIPNLGNGC